MPRRLAPVDNKTWRKFLNHIGCKKIRQKGDHLVYSREGLIRPIIFRSRGDVPILHIKTCLKTLGMTIQEFLGIISSF